MIDPYRAFVDETLARYPRLRATRLHDMLVARGYAGAERTLRQYVAQVRRAQAILAVDLHERLKRLARVSLGK